MSCSSDEVYEVNAGGCVDISSAPPPPPPHEVSKALGNAAFASGDYALAASHYSASLTACPFGTDPCFQSVLYSNRSACHGKLGALSAAVSDSRTAVVLDASNVKAHFRRATYCLDSKEYDEALAACDAGLKLEGGNAPLLKLRQRAKAGLATAPKTSKQAVLPLAGANLYEEKTEKLGMERELLRQLKADLASGKASKTHSSLNGMFATLMNPAMFQKTIFPGLSEEARQTAPRTLHELLSNPQYESEMASVGIPSAKKKAHQVLANVKKKGADAGQYMDAATEASLFPQILQEAIAHQVVAVVNTVHKRMHSNKGIGASLACAISAAVFLNALPTRMGDEPREKIPVSDEMLAMLPMLLPEDDCGSEGEGEDEGRLPVEAAMGLMCYPTSAPRGPISATLALPAPDSAVEGLQLGSGWFVLDDFFGSDAFSVISAALKKDCRRMDRAGRLSDVPVLKKAGEQSLDKDGGGVVTSGLGKIAWVNDKELDKDYAALAEVISCLRGLPLELNLHANATYEDRRDDAMLLKVAKPAAGEPVAVTCRRKGDVQPPRVDGGDDVGHAVSALYFVGDVGSSGGGDGKAAAGRSGALRLKNLSDGSTAVIEPRPDRLDCFRCKDVENERLEVLGAEEEQFAVQVWMHGCVTTREAIEEAVGRLKDAKMGNLKAPAVIGGK